MIDNKMKILVIDVGSHPVKTEKFVFTAAERELAKTTVLTTMNRLGKNSEALVRIENGDMFVYSHTAKRGSSKELYRRKVQYHPLASELA